MMWNWGKLLRSPRMIIEKVKRIKFWPQARKLKRVGRNFRIGKDSIIVGGRGIQIGEAFSAHARTRLETYHQMQNEPECVKLVIGNHVSLGYDCHIGAIGAVSIGDNVLIGSRVYISDHHHGSSMPDELVIPPLQRRLFFKGPVVIEEDVWIGEGAAILPGVTIGKGTVVGANSVVTKSFPAYSIVGGVPAKMIRSGIINHRVEHL